MQYGCRAGQSFCSAFQGCLNEPVFASLSALVYQHSMTPLALPCRLLLPEQDMTTGHQPVYSEDNLQRLMDQGAGMSVIPGQGKFEKVYDTTKSFIPCLLSF